MEVVSNPGVGAPLPQFLASLAKPSSQKGEGVKSTSPQVATLGRGGPTGVVQRGGLHVGRPLCLFH